MYKDRPKINPKSFINSWQIIKEIPKLSFHRLLHTMGRVFYRNPLGIGEKASRHVLTATNVNSSVRHQRRPSKPINGPGQCWTCISICVTVGFCSGVGFGIWNISLLVTFLWWWTWLMGVLYGAFATYTSEVSQCLSWKNIKEKNSKLSK